jgi:hypothetical protein
MPATDFTERITIILPVARVANFGTWWQANIDPSDDCTTWPALNAAGDNSPATHRWCCTALTLPKVRKLMVRLCQVSGITQPAQWDTRNRAQKRQWLLSNRAAIRTAIGVWIGHTDNDQAWERFDDHLETMGLKRKQVQAI